MNIGKDGLLELELLPAGPGRRRVRAPLSLGRVLYTDPSSPTTQVIYVRATGDGLAQGDHLHTSITVRPGAHGVVTSQAATRIHSMTSTGGAASQDTILTVDSGGVLEYLPDPIIASRASRFSQSTVLRARHGAVAIIGDSFTAGRIAHGEFHDADSIDLRAELYTESSELIDAPAFIERAAYRGKADLMSPIIHADFTAWANLWVVCPQRATQAVLTAWREYPLSDLPAESSPHISVGASALPEDAGCWARFMGSSIEEVSQLQFEYWDRARRIILGRPAFNLRKM